MPAKPSKGEIVFRCEFDDDDDEEEDAMPLPLFTVAGVLLTELAGVICGVIGGSTFGLAIVAAPRALVWLLSLRRFGASLILG